MKYAVSIFLIGYANGEFARSMWLSCTSDLPVTHIR